MCVYRAIFINDVLTHTRSTTRFILSDSQQHEHQALSVASFFFFFFCGGLRSVVRVLLCLYSCNIGEIFSRDLSALPVNALNYGCFYEYLSHTLKAKVLYTYMLLKT